MDERGRQRAGGPRGGGPRLSGRFGHADTSLHAPPASAPPAGKGDAGTRLPETHRPGWRAGGARTGGPLPASSPLTHDGERRRDRLRPCVCRSVHGVRKDWSSGPRCPPPSRGRDPAPSGGRPRPCDKPPVRRAWRATCSEEKRKAEDDAGRRQTPSFCWGRASRTA